MFKKLKNSQKSFIFKIKQYQNNIKSTWNVMKAVMGKSKICNDKFPKSLDINKEEITDKKISRYFQ